MSFILFIFYFVLISFFSSLLLTRESCYKLMLLVGVSRHVQKNRERMSKLRICCCACTRMCSEPRTIVFSNGQENQVRRSSSSIVVRDNHVQDLARPADAEPTAIARLRCAFQGLRKVQPGMPRRIRKPQADAWTPWRVVHGFRVVDSHPAASTSASTSRSASRPGSIGEHS